MSELTVQDRSPSFATGSARAQFTRARDRRELQCGGRGGAAAQRLYGRNPDDALAAADAADKARGSGELGPLAGIPLGIKDLFATKGVDTTAGSRILKGFKPPYESTVSANLRKAGAGMLGKLNMDEFAMGSSNETSAYGPVISPWRRKRQQCRADSGRIARAARRRRSRRGIAPGATGTDTGGSIRQPAAFVGICGIKPTYGRCSRWGIVAFASSLDQAGPMARTCATARSCSRRWRASIRRIRLRSTCRCRNGKPNLSSDLRGKRVGIPKEYRIDGVPAEINACGTRASNG